MDGDPQFKMGDGTHLRIWTAAVQNPFQSEKNGRPLFDEVTFVEAISPGSASSCPVFEVKRKYCDEAKIKEPVLSDHYKRFAQWVEAYESHEETDKSLIGTPLTQWPEISRSLAASLKAQNIHSVDALAALPDERLGAVGPDGRVWREKAKAFIALAESSAAGTAMAAELEALRASLADKDRQIAELAASVAKIQQDSFATDVAKLASETPKAEKPKPTEPVV